MRAIAPSVIMAPKKILCAELCFLMHRAIMGVCVEWKPDKAPHEMMMKMLGYQEEPSGAVESIDGNGLPEATVPASNPSVIKMRDAPKNG
mmetsp:Transcript_59452/g.125958  ORF Transcript_59452/g.125958 Transcript_59452/m.125958 type:complete len:90 (-) Transcript_59452:37-306(-)